MRCIATCKLPREVSGCSSRGTLRQHDKRKQRNINLTQQKQRQTKNGAHQEEEKKDGEEEEDGEDDGEDDDDEGDGET